MVLATILVIIVLGLIIVGIGGLIALPKPKLYEYKGNVYRVISKAKVKNQVTRKWENSYIYVSVKDDTVVPERDSSYPPMYKLRTRWALEDCTPIGRTSKLFEEYIELMGIRKSSYGDLMACVVPPRVEHSKYMFQFGELMHKYGTELITVVPGPVILNDFGVWESTSKESFFNLYGVFPVRSFEDINIYNSSKVV